MPKFSPESQRQLATCDERLQVLFLEVVKTWDCTVLEGKRTLEKQRENLARGVSKTLQSKHVFPTSGPSLAVDVAPYPLRWPKARRDDSPEELRRWMKDYARYYYFAGFVLGRADALGISVRHGGDWDGDRDIHDQDFDDLPHFELRV